MLTQSYLKELFDYRHDGYLIRKIKTCNRVNVGDIVGCNNGNNYLKIHLCGKQNYAHRLIFIWHYGFLPKEIDHINGNSLDNRIENLREATHLQNGKNLNLRKSNSIGISGVRWDAQRNKWHSSITVDGTKKHLGRFASLNDAIEKRKKAEILFFQEWRRTNEASC